MEGVIAPRQYVGVKKVLEECTDMSQHYLKKLDILFPMFEEKARKAQMNIQFAMPVKLQMTMSALNSMASSYQKEEQIITSNTLLKCMDKINRIHGENLEFIGTIIVQHELKGADLDFAAINAVHRDLKIKYEHQSKAFENLVKNYEINSAQFSPESWTIDRLIQIMPCILMSAEQYSKVLTEEEIKFKALNMDQDSEIGLKQGIERDCQIKMAQLRILSSDSWTNGHGASFQTPIKERRDYMQKLEREVKEMILNINSSISRLDAIVSRGENLECSAQDFKRQHDTAESFKHGIEVRKSFRGMLCEQIQITLMIRDLSAQMVVSCLKYDHNDLYRQVSRDRMISKFMRIHVHWGELDLHTEEKKVNPISSYEIVRMLTDAFILPLDDLSPKSDAQLRKHLIEKYTDTMIVDELETFPKSNTLESELAENSLHRPYAIPRRPSKAPARFESLFDESGCTNGNVSLVKRAVSFTVDQQREDDSTLSRLIKNFKEGFSKFIPLANKSPEKKFTVRVSSRGERNPFSSAPNSRKSSYVTALEMSSNFGDSEREQSEEVNNQKEDYLSAVMRENSRLRRIVYEGRKESNPLLEQTAKKQSISVTKTDYVRHQRKNQLNATKLQRWISEQQKIDYNRDDAVDSTSSSVVDSSVKNTTTLAAAVAVGVHAAQRVILAENKRMASRKDSKAFKNIFGPQNASVLQMRVQPEHLNVKNLNIQTGEDYFRKDSGIATTTRQNSSDEVPGLVVIKYRQI